MTKTRAKHGLSAVEVIIALVLGVVVVLFLMLAMPRNRESARRATCQRNLMQIGMALGLYHQVIGHLPASQLNGESPLAQMLAELSQPDFLGLTDRKLRPPKGKTLPPGERAVRGFVCPSDSNATDGTHPAPISYRANTGDTTDGHHGPFAIGQVVTLKSVDATKGVSFTAAFAERMVGTDHPDDLASYSLIAGIVGATGCGDVDLASRRTDAGSNWLKSTWVSTLYNHAATPNSLPSCISTDGKTAMMGTSSAHPEGVHVLLLDGSVKSYRTSIDPSIWKTLGTTGESTR